MLSRNQIWIITGYSFMEKLYLFCLAQAKQPTFRLSWLHRWAAHSNLNRDDKFQEDM